MPRPVLEFQRFSQTGPAAVFASLDGFVERKKYRNSEGPLLGYSPKKRLWLSRSMQEESVEKLDGARVL